VDVVELTPTSAKAAFRNDFDERRHGSPEQTGSFGAGFAAGLFGGIVGMIAVLAIAKGTATKHGARFGFATQLVAGILIRMLAAA
jgi:hypothetical protein